MKIKFEVIRKSGKKLSRFIILSEYDRCFEVTKAQKNTNRIFGPF